MRVYLVHGWGMNSAVWQDCLAALPADIDPVCIDLPGHGLQWHVDANSLDDLAVHAGHHADRPGLWIGWSLGGLVTLQVARETPDRVSGLLQVTCNPCFVQREDWTCAVEQDVFDAFGESLHNDVASTIRRFLALQVRGTGTGMSTVRALHSALNARGQAAPAALQVGLDILTRTDARDMLHELDVPQHWVFGDRDALVPVTAAERIAGMNPEIEIHRIQGAGHAPFISHADAFIDVFTAVIDSLK